MKQSIEEKYSKIEANKELLEQGICPLCNTPNLRHEQVFHVNLLICDNCQQDYRVIPSNNRKNKNNEKEN